MQGEPAFGIDSNVGRYWLVHAEGFDVVAARGRRLGVVQDLVVNPQTREVSGVVVRRRLPGWIRRPARVPVGELRSVLPRSRRFVLTPRERPGRTRTWAAVAGRQGVLAARHGGHASSVAARHTGRAVAVGTAVAATQAREKWPTVRHAVAVAADRTGRALAVAARHTGRALAAAAAWTAVLVRRAWQTSRVWLRDSDLYARARDFATRSFSGPRS
jgi:hypothetical protein